MRQRWEVDELIESWTLDLDDVRLVTDLLGLAVVSGGEAVRVRRFLRTAWRSFE